jgi:hypothetical protein
MRIAAFVDIKDAVDEPGQRRFTTARLPHNGHRLTPDWPRKADILENRAAVVGKADIFKAPAR